LLKIIELHTSPYAGGEYVVLQNHGLTTLSLRGWALCGNSFLTGDAQAAAREMYIFSEDIPIKPYGRVVLFTGEGEDGWYQTVDGKQAFLVYWGRKNPVWSETGDVFLLKTTCSRKVSCGEVAEMVARA
jgi:hypothetical protein